LQKLGKIFNYTHHKIMHFVWAKCTTSETQKEIAEKIDYINCKAFSRVKLRLPKPLEELYEDYVESLTESMLCSSQQISMDSELPLAFTVGYKGIKS